KIRTKSGATVPLLLNRSQRFLHDAIEEQRRRTGKVRKIVLKGRQVGISTYIGGRLYWRTSHARGHRAFILTHLDDATDNLFNIAKRLHDNCPAPVRPSTGKANAKELSFDLLDSGYRVATAGNKSVGRSDTIQLFHGSEVAFWPNAEEHFAGIMQAVAGTPDTEVILESTANGIGNVFHTVTMRAQKGESEFELVFIPWYWHEEYSRPAASDWRPPPGWAEYGLLHGLDRGQLFWAFQKNRDLVVMAGGDTHEPSPKFKQEYPGTAAEAFETSGANAFIDPLKVLRARRANVAGYGPIILGVDPARGGKDKTGFIDRQGRRSGRHVCKRVDFGENTMAIAGEVVRLVEQLRQAADGSRVKVAIDTTGLGGPIYDRLREMLPSHELEPVNFGEKAFETEKYANRRAEMWDLKRQWYEDPACVQVPDSDEFQGDECAPIRDRGATHFRSNGQLILEDKDHIKQRLGFSPDLGDAHALTFAINMDALARYSDGPHRRRRPGNEGTSWLSA
ncbi:MAG: hypothetical protein AB7O44_33300, partial [Hyphomicrobiaceae bacterium]